MREEGGSRHGGAEKAARGSRGDYAHFLRIPTRWIDNDVYGHVNNVVFYSFFDTAVNHYLVEAGALDIAASPVIGLVVETQCRFHAPVSFPTPVDAGLRLGRLGNTSIRYEIGIFAGAEDAAAEGHFVHVYVDRATRRPAPLPPALVAAARKLECG